MRLLVNTARWEVIILIASFAVVTLWKLITATSFAGLLRANDGSMSPGRIQLLVLTMLSALQYLLAAIQDPSHLPSLPSGLVAAVGASQLVYLGSKAWTNFQLKGNNSEAK